MKKLLLGAAVLLAGGLAYGYHTLSPTANGGSGYAAKNLCSGYFLSGFSGDVIHEQALIGAAEVLSNVSYEIDTEERHVDAKIYGLFERRAEYVDGVGCVLLPAGEKSWNQSVAPASPPALDDATPWPFGRATPAKSDKYDVLLDAAFAEEDPARPRHTKAVVIVHDGQLIAERYAPGVGQDAGLIGWSMAKSVTALLIGILSGDGVLDVGAAADVPLWREDPDDPRGAITLDQLLRMSSGLEFGETYSTQSDVTQMLSNESDTAAFAAGKPLEFEPDTHWSYSSGTSNIVSAIVQRSVGGDLQSYYDFVQSRLFQPLSIRTAIYEPDASGNFIGSSYLYASARDWARLGQLCLQDGVWNGARIWPEGWIEYVTTPTKTEPSNVYGAHFWLNAAPSDGGDRPWPKLPADTYYFSGFQGQAVVVVPSKNIVAVRLGFTPDRNHGIEDLIAGVIEILDAEAVSAPPESETDVVDDGEVEE